MQYCLWLIIAADVIPHLLCCCYVVKTILSKKTSCVHVILKKGLCSRNECYLAV